MRPTVACTNLYVYTQIQTKGDYLFFLFLLLGNHPFQTTKFGIHSSTDPKTYRGTQLIAHPCTTLHKYNMSQKSRGQGPEEPQFGHPCCIEFSDEISEACLLLLLLFTRPLPRDGGMAEDHGAPEAGQLPRVWTRGHKETESRQRVSGAKSP